MHRNSNKTQESLNFLRSAYGIRYDFFGENHVQTAIAMSILGMSYFGLGDFISACFYQKKAYDILLTFYGLNNHYTKESLEALQNIEIAEQCI